ncbi:MAG: tail fiber protein [Bacteroidia bacterium]|nr:tail fiber protein [Bacteroidia bacterium]
MYVGTIGEIRLFAGNFAPLHWAFCDGQLLTIRDHTALFAVIGTTYGGDGQTTFALPDLRGRIAIGVGESSGHSSTALGEQSGQTSITLNELNLPGHVHNAAAQLHASSQQANTTDPTSAVHALEGGGRSYDVNAPQNIVNMRADALFIEGGVTAPAGQSTPVPAYQPSLGLNYCICMAGTFPRRG